MAKKIKKILVTTGIVSLMMIGTLIGKTDNHNYFGNITAYASEVQSQSPRWEGQGDVWRVKDNAGGYLVNSWFQDLDSSWYMLGADGVMYSGLVTDQSTGKTYLLNTNHDGTYGRMITTDGMVAVNEVSVYMTFNQNHDGSYGAITGGLTEARSTGVKETGLSSIPTDSATTSTTSNNSNTSNTNNSNTSNSNSYPDTGSGIDWSQYDPSDFDIGKGTGKDFGWH